MRLQFLHTGTLKLDGGAMFGVVPKKIWQKLNPPDENNLCTWAMRCLLIEDGDRLILVDSGMGDKQSEKFFSFYEPQGPGVVGALRQAGYTPEDVTDHILTHLHFDHCGGSVIRHGASGELIPTFPNAKYYIHQDHWHAATHPNAREKASFLKENILPIEEGGRWTYINEQSHIGPITFRFSEGHTDAMAIPMLDYQGRKWCYMADLFPSIHHIPPHFNMSYDIRPLSIMDEKKSFLEEAVDGGWVMMFEHDPKNECCTVSKTENGIKVDDAFLLTS